MRFIFLVLSISSFLPLHAKEIHSILVHPPFDKYYVCAEHWEGQFKEVGDALGTDCMVSKIVDGGKGLAWLRQYKDEGKQNEDWFGWNESVLAPINGKVLKINLNEAVNLPGSMGTGQASYIIISGSSGMSAIVAHVQGIKVRVGESVKAGQAVALVGNNGQSRHPHIHLGAWKNGEPLQIRFDQTKLMGRP